MPRSKLKKFEEITNLEKVIEPSKPIYNDLKGKWADLIFKNKNEIVLELGCGYGEYTNGLAEKFPEKNFIGVDIKGERVWKAATDSNELKLLNSVFLRTQIENITNFFNPNEVSEIWITFPDPRPRDKESKKRLTNPRFLEMYQQIIKPGGIIHLKTDNLELFEYTLEVLKTQKIKNINYTLDLYNSDLQNFTLGLETRFEKLFLPKVKTIKYLNFQFN